MRGYEAAVLYCAFFYAVQDSAGLSEWQLLCYHQLCRHRKCCIVFHTHELHIPPILVHTVLVQKKEKSWEIRIIFRSIVLIWGMKKIAWKTFWDIYLFSRVRALDCGWCWLKGLSMSHILLINYKTRKTMGCNFLLNSYIYYSLLNLVWSGNIIKVELKRCH